MVGHAEAARAPVLSLPGLVFNGREWAPSEVAGLAAHWREALRPLVPPHGLTAMVMANHPRSVALFSGLAQLPSSLVLLPPHPGGWESSPPVPRGTLLALLPEQAAWAVEAERMELEPVVLADGTSASAGPEPVAVLSSPGVVIFTSGSTDLPKPVYRPLERVLGAARSLVEAFGLTPGAGVVGTLPLARGFGLIHALMVAAVLRGRLALLDRFEPATVLALFASGDYEYWPTSPVTIDLIARHAPRAAPSAPRICLTPGRPPGDACDRFRIRFGVPVRQTYGTTETGPATVDAAPAPRVRSETAGRAVPGVRLAVGDDPLAPLGPGVLGRLWVSSPGQMLGYGFPPHLELPERRGEWLATRDVGHLDESGALTLAGRVDECVRTGAGYLVNPADIARVLEEHPGVTDAAVVPLPDAHGVVLGVLVQGAAGVAASDLRRHLARRMPPWCQPRVVEVTRELPRLPGGKTDRVACAAILDGLRQGQTAREERSR